MSEDISEERTVQDSTQADKFISMGNYAEARTILEGILRENPADAEAHWKLGNILRSQNDIITAFREYRLAARNGRENYRETDYDILRERLENLENFSKADLKSIIEEIIALNGTVHRGAVNNILDSFELVKKELLRVWKQATVPDSIIVSAFDNLKGTSAVPGLISNVLFLKNKSVYNICVHLLVLGLNKIGKFSLVSVNSGNKYIAYNAAANEFKRTEKIQPEAVDWLLTYVGQEESMDPTIWERSNPDITPESAPGDEQEQYTHFVLITGSEKYKDEPTKYHFKKGIPGSEQLRAAENRGKFVYYENGEFYAKGRIGKITSYEENDTTYYFADVEDYVRIGPIAFDEIKSDLSFSYVGQAGIRKISEADYNAIIGPAVLDSGFLWADLNLKLGEISFGPLLFEDEGLLKSQIYAALKSGKNVMLVGPPGTGKTEIALTLCRIAKEKKYIHDYVMTTATSDWTTFDTIGGYVPDKEGKCLEFMLGQFLSCFREGNRPVNKWLVIDEINRSDIDKAFGQLFTVLSGQSVELPFHTEFGPIRITPNKVPARAGTNQNEYIVPKSWRLIATLNTYDKASLYQMSYAFMRRFAFIYLAVPTSDFIDKNWDRYTAGWKIEVSDKLKPCAYDLKALWKEMNEADSKRPLGPAIIKDMLELINGHEDESETLTEELKKRLLTDAVESYVIPQFEGLEKDDYEILKEKLNKYCVRARIEARFREMFEI
jgi:MoxR-like ATPase